MMLVICDEIDHVLTLSFYRITFELYQGTLMPGFISLYIDVQFRIKFSVYR